MTIRCVEISDAERMLELRKRLDGETRFMLLEPGERATTVEEQARELELVLMHDNQAVLVAEADGALVGFLGAYGGRYRRNRHNAHVVIGVLQSYAGQGIGTRLFRGLEAWARAHGVQRLELSVMAHNARGVALYHKMGFRIEGIARRALFVDDEWVDEYHMARLL